MAESTAMKEKKINFLLASPPQAFLDPVCEGLVRYPDEYVWKFRTDV